MVTDKTFNRGMLVLSCYFLLGAFALISQTMILREFFVVVFGNEFIFGVSITNWLIGISLGALIGGAVSQRTGHPLRLFVLSILTMCLLLPLIITAVRFLYIISGTPAGSYVGFFKVFIYSALLVIPISFLVGFVFPLAARVQLALAAQKGQVSDSTRLIKVKGISDIYIFEALGSLVSGILYTFLMVGRLNAYWITGLASLPLAFCTLLLLRKTAYPVTRALATIVIVINCVLLWPTVNRQLETLTVHGRWHSVSSMPLAFSKDSRYQNIAVSGMMGRNHLYLNTMFASVFPNEEDNMIMAAHLLCQHPNPKRILVIGDAVSGLATFLLKSNTEKVVSVEIDRAVVDTVLEYLPEEEKEVVQDPRFQMVIQDGRKYVKDLVRQKGHFDIVYINEPEPSTLLLNRYYTVGFFRDLSQVVGEDGVIALKMTASENYGKGVVTDYGATIFNTVRAVFPAIVVTPGTESLIFASQQSQSISDSPDLLEKRYQALGLEPARLGLIFQSLYPAERTRIARKTLENNRYNRVNTDETPIAPLYFNKIIGWYGKSNLAALLGFVETIDFHDILLAVMGLFLIRMVWVLGVFYKKRYQLRHRRRLRHHTLFAVFAGGMAGLSLELVIIYTFQDSFGDVYYIIGFIIALFMIGLPVGATASSRWLGRKGWGNETRAVSGVAVTLTGLSVLALVLPVVMHLFYRMIWLNQIIIFLSTMSVGIVIGFIFPLAVHLYLGQRGEAGRTAGIVDAFDHLGAAVGALIVGTLLLPVIGVNNVCRLSALVPLLAAILLFVDKTLSYRS